jgi:hypothetical protein
LFICLCSVLLGFGGLSTVLHCVYVLYHGCRWSCCSVICFVLNVGDIICYLYQHVQIVRN